MQLVRKFCPLLLELPLNQLSALNPIGVCKTVSGPDANKPCVFPFRFKGITYNTCSFEKSSRPWCSTRVDKKGNHISGGGHYGDCQRHCPMPDWKPRSGKAINKRSIESFDDETNQDQDDYGEYPSLSQDSTPFKNILH